MDAWQKWLRLAAVAFACVCMLPARALASTTEQSMMIDDDQLIYSTPAHTAQVMEQLHALGVDSVKVSVVWSLLAPDPFATTRPAGFDASNPADYPAANWTRYDSIVEDAKALGMAVYFQLGGAAPVWARAPQPNQGPYLSHYPKPSEYEQYVEAVGRRYDGDYQITQTSADPASDAGLLGLADSQPTTQTTTTTLPAVTEWEIWNEPNELQWLSPYYRLVGKTKLPVQPYEYRTLVDAGWQGLVASGHKTNTVLVGETANAGAVTPMSFLQDVYCVGTNDLPLRGTAAKNLECPASGSAASFVSAHPGLFESSGWAHHPYSFNVAPNKPNPIKTFIDLDNLGVMERGLDRIFAAYGDPQPHGRPMYLTEWGYESNPPNPFVHTTLSEQELWLNQGEYMTWLDPYVKALAQFELVDDGGKPHKTPGTHAYWSTFQTGLEYVSGAPKPSYAAFEVPIWLPSQRTGSNVTVWGELRPGPHTQTQFALIQFQAKGSSQWTTLREIATTNSEGYVVTHLPITKPGQVRIADPNPVDGTVDYSRTIPVS